MKRPRARYLVMAIIAALALIVGLGGSMIWGNKSAKDRIQADPAPALFHDATIAPADRLVDPQAAKAHAMMKQWWAAHGQAPKDEAFVAWVGQTFPKPPSQADHRRELAQLKQLNANHTPQGITASTWLEAHGKKDIWKLYAHDQAEWLPSKAGDARKADVKAILKLSGKAADQLAARYPSSAPYVLDRGLLDPRSEDQDPIKKLKSEKRPCPCSYPSRHAAKAAAVRTYLGFSQPHMTAQYRWMEDEIDWSRMYMGGHFPSDIAGGALLGDMVGEYYLVTRVGAAPQDLNRPSAG
ncbi:MAG TPA: phosphatase PAP2 family protein [Aeromicrobium sp.]|nr:phosphatase PAP2 family protein [Aeromicrobium sp.]